MIERDTRIDEVTDGNYRVEKHNGVIKKKVKLNPIKHSSKKSVREKIKQEMENPPIPIEVQIIVDNDRKGEFIATELNESIMNLPYIDDIKKQKNDLPMSEKIENGGEALHVGVYTIIQHWVGNRDKQNSDN